MGMVANVLKLRTVRIICKLHDIITIFVACALQQSQPQ